MRILKKLKFLCVITAAIMQVFDGKLFDTVGIVTSRPIVNEVQKATSFDVTFAKPNLQLNKRNKHQTKSKALNAFLMP
jgi:hypothetical protein